MMNDNSSMPFVSATLPATFSDTKPAMPLFPMRNEMQPVGVSMAMDDMDHLYPEIYHEVFPLIIDAADRMVAEGFTPAPDSMGGIVDNIIKNSGLWYEDEDDPNYGYDAEAIPVQNMRGHMPFRRHRRGHHNRNTLRDIIRILLLRELVSRRRGFDNRRY